jgi:SET domain-containing protein
MAETYRPLPDSLTIMPSKIEGLGLFALKNIPASKSLGMTHYYLPGEPNDQIRTPLGGFINHSDTPNCALYKVGNKSYLVPEQDIEPLEELTVKYTMYKV